MISKYKKHLQLSLAVVVGAGALALIIPTQAHAQSSLICFRGNTITVPTYLVSRYIAAGATSGACVISP